ncbi:hypothetical protein CPB83DRAFT_69332 [Crepidotus variabilis]|uniref:Uncharacterized protein n=1 Tax=Crepidotus variabilis TaxID=179855 RepID=A0A9P6E5K8_9AGAR|nr:hypothetical protein CPB83DRAFT_69332 [Crepidotus variabilis]
MPQTLKAFCFILEKWNNSRSRGASTVCDEDFKKTQSIVATSLHQWFGPLSQETLDLFALFTCFRPRSKETTFEAALEDIGKQSYPSFDAALCAIDSANAFVTLDQEDFPSFGSTRDARICVNSTIMDILTNPDLIGEKVYNANRSAWILALTRCYNDLLLEDFSSSSFQPKASGVFDLLIIRLDTFTLKDNIDNCHGSTMEALITRICSPESLVFLRNAAAFGHSLSRFYAPFFLFITMNCLQASVLGPHFEDIHNKLNNLIATLLEAGVLAAAFDVLELEDNRNIIIYENLFNMGKLGQGQWLNLVDDKTHTAILEFFLNTFAVGRLVSYPHGIFWTDHFSAANNSWEIRQALLSLKDDSWILEKVGPLLPESFVLGAKTWKDTHLADDLESAQAIDELCMELSSMHRASISDLNKQENSDTSENNEIGNDQDSDGVYEDMVEPDEDSDEEYEDAVEEIESETEDLSSP